MKPLALCTRRFLSIKSWVNMLHSLRNSLKVCLLAMYFRTRSKKAKSSPIPLLLEIGASGCGSAGTSDGDTAGTSGAVGLGCCNLARCQEEL